MKTLETDIQTQERRNENLIERLSELPKNIPAEGIYKQIQANTTKVVELKSALESIRSQENQMRTKAVWIVNGYYSEFEGRFKILKKLQSSIAEASTET